MNHTKQGILIDLYDDPKERGTCLWVIEENGNRSQYFHRMPVPIYVDGTNELKRSIWKQLREYSKTPVHLEKETKIHPFDGSKRQMLAIYAGTTKLVRRIGYQLEKQYPGIDLFDMTVDIHHRYAAIYGLFPFCHFEYTYEDETNEILEMQAIEDRWGQQNNLPIRIFEMRINSDPSFLKDKILYHLKSGPYQQTVDISKSIGIKNLLSFIKREDPDILLTDFGDSFLLPYLLKATENYIFPFPFCREESVAPLIKEPMTLSSYGRTLQRKQQVHLFGRIHLDTQTMPEFSEGGIDGVLEVGRISAMPLQETARSSSGRAVASLEIIEAVRSNTVLPYKIQKLETLRSGNNFIRGDRGGLIYSPPEGVFENVLCIDFDSMFPSIMVHKNLSPETVDDPETDLVGVIPRALHPLLKRRLYYKKQIRSLQPEDCRFTIYKNRSDMLKMLLVVSFGYSSFRAAPLSSPIIFEEINRQGREAMFKAKELAEDRGFEVLHAYIDGLFLHRVPPPKEEEIESILHDITESTKLPISEEGMFKWVVFLPSRTNSLVTVSNAYFGAFLNGDIKIRGIQSRRSDQPKIVKDFQRELIQMMAKGDTIEEVRELFPKVHGMVLEYAERIRSKSVDIEDLVVTIRLSRNLDEFKVASHAAIAAGQLSDVGREIKAGEKVRFVYVKGRPRVKAFSLLESSVKIDTNAYLKYIEEAAKTVLLPFGSDEEFLHNLIHQSMPAKQLKMLLY